MIVSASEILAFFDSVGPNYPGGIPREVGGGVTPTPEGGVPPFQIHGPLDGPLLFLGFADESGSLVQGSTGALLDAAISRGLRRDPATIGFVTISAAVTSSDLVGVLPRLLPSVGIALGTRAASLLGLPGECSTWGELNGSPWLTTLELSAVLAEPGQKRLFWNDLQTVLRKLELVEGGR